MLFELFLVNLGDDDVVNVRFDVWPEEGSPQAGTAAAVPPHSIFRLGPPLDLGRRMPVAISARIAWEAGDQGPSQRQSRLVVSRKGGEIVVSPPGSPLSDVLESRGIPAEVAPEGLAAILLDEPGAVSDGKISDGPAGDGPSAAAFSYPESDVPFPEATFDAADDYEEDGHLVDGDRWITSVDPSGSELLLGKPADSPGVDEGPQDDDPLLPVIDEPGEPERGSLIIRLDPDVDDATTPTVGAGMETQPMPEEERFDALLCQRKLEEAWQALSEISPADRGAACEKRWRWAAGMELSARARKASRFLLKSRSHRARELVGELKALVRLAPGLNREASEDISQLGKTVLRVLPRGLPMINMHQIAADLAALPGMPDDVREHLDVWSQALGDAIETLDRVNQEPPRGWLARWKHKRRIWKALDGLDRRWNLDEAWVVYSLISQMDRWPNVLRMLQPDLFAEKQPSYRSNLGLRLLGEGNYGDAVKELREAIRLKPDLAAAHNNLAWVHVVSGDPSLVSLDEAIRHAEEAIRLSPATAFFDTLAELERSRGDIDAAITAMQRAMESDNVDPERWADKLEDLLTEKRASSQPGREHYL